MAWTVRYQPKAQQDLAALDKPVARRIVDYLDKVASLDDPTTRGKALSGNLSGMWCYRVGAWRVICDLYDGQLIVLVLAIGHRSDVY